MILAFLIAVLVQSRSGCSESEVTTYIISKSPALPGNYTFLGKGWSDSWRDGLLQAARLSLAISEINDDDM